MNAQAEKATFAAGCFWGVEVDFRNTPGVTDVRVGYTGGHTDEPTYEQVCSGTTGHAEVVQVEFDPDQISYEELLKVFWDMHDPTHVNRQGPDFGEQYRTVIFYMDAEQETAARASKERIQERYRKPIATSIEPTTGFWRAEEYHQCYLEKRGQQGGLAGMMRSVLGS